MLFTRCPDCQTTFRVTNELLHKADGQVRCGRCSNIFNAYAYLRERLEAPSLEPQLAPQPASPSAAPDPSAGANAAGTAAAEVPASAPGTVSVHAAESSPSKAYAAAVSAARPPPARPASGAAQMPADAPAARSPAAPSPTPVQAGAADESIDDERVQAVLENTGRNIFAVASWQLYDSARAPVHRALWWRVAAGSAGAILAVQLLHHFSGSLATRPVVGPVVGLAYSLLGIELVPDWNVEQYEVVDWIAAAEPDDDGRSNLVITARIHNRGPRAQPYPHVQLQLLDRWETAVGRRVFSPQEYLPVASSSDSMMEAGDTARAQLVVVDPGPDAYGFELDVCVGTQTQLNCTGGRVFR